MKLAWDCNTRDLPENPSGGFTLIDNPSAQNAGIILEGKAFNILQPQFGIGYNNQVLGGNVANATFELNRAVGQIQADGGKASWKSIPPPPNVQFDFELDANYL